MAAAVTRPQRPLRISVIPDRASQLPGMPGYSVPAAASCRQLPQSCCGSSQKILSWALSIQAVDNRPIPAIISSNRTRTGFCKLPVVLSLCDRPRACEGGGDSPPSILPTCVRCFSSGLSPGHRKSSYRRGNEERRRYDDEQETSQPSHRAAV